MKKVSRKKQPDLFTKTNAERQRDYRSRQKEQQGVRLDMYLDKDTHTMLERIATTGNVSIKAALADIIKKEYQAITLD